MNTGLLGFPVGSDKGLRIRQRRYALIRDERAAGTSAGDPPSTSAFYTRALTVVAYDEIGLYLVSNQIIVAAGRYRCRIRAMMMNTGVTMIRLRDVTAGRTMATGYGGYGDQGNSYVQGVAQGRGDFVVSRDGTRLELQQNSQGNPASSWGQGIGTYAESPTTEKYGTVELWRMGS